MLEKSTDHTAVKSVQHIREEKQSLQDRQLVLDDNARVIHAELKWLKIFLHERIRLHGDIMTQEEVLSFPPPSLEEKDVPYAQFVLSHRMTDNQRLMLIMALAPAYKPETFDPLIDKSRGYRIKSPEFGGILDSVNGQFIPTLKTLIFLISGEDPVATNRLYNTFLQENVLLTEQIIIFRNAALGDDRVVNSEIKLANEFVGHLLQGHDPSPTFNMEFPAKKLKTTLEWDDLIVSAQTFKQLQNIVDWVKYGSQVLENQGSKAKIKEGYPVLFYGPPGTGKTLAASLIGNACGKEVYQVDLSMVVSKYIGETEKNLGRLFDKAEHKNWILFFDEADALFGKRAQVKDAHDKYANQEMSYLLQRMEQFTGLTVLTTNFDQNVDPAMTRRFQSKVYFSKPGPEDRKRLWISQLPEGYQYHPEISMDSLGEAFKVTGANIINILRQCCVRAEKRGDRMILPQDLLETARIELSKEGRTI